MRSRPVRQSSTSDRCAQTTPRTRLRRDRQPDASAFRRNHPRARGRDRKRALAAQAHQCSPGHEVPGQFAAEPDPPERHAQQPHGGTRAAFATHSAHRSKPNSPAPRRPSAEAASRPSAIGARSARSGFVRLHPRDAPRTPYGMRVLDRGRARFPRRRGAKRRCARRRQYLPVRSRWQPSACAATTLRTTVGPQHRGSDSTHRPDRDQPKRRAADARHEHDHGHPQRPRTRAPATLARPSAVGRPSSSLGSSSPAPRNSSSSNDAVHLARSAAEHHLRPPRRSTRGGRGPDRGAFRAPAAHALAGAAAPPRLRLGGRGPAGRAYGGLGWS